MREYPQFIADDKFLSMDNSQRLVDRQEAMLGNLKRVYTLSNQDYSSFDELIRTYLEAGREVFHLETGIVSQIKNGIYTVKDVVSDLGVINPGDEYPIEGTYCNEVFKSQKVVGLPNVGALDFMKNHPVYENLKLEAYLSAPILVDGVLYGTLNFTSLSIRQFGFSEHERDLIELMAAAIGNFVLLRNREEELKLSNRKLKQFVGFVTHDLRNPIGSIQSMSQLGLKPEATEERRKNVLESIYSQSEIALEFVHSILEVAALSTGKISPELCHVLLIEVLNESLTAISEISESRGVRFLIDVNSEILIEVDRSRLRQVLVNLFINAVKYSPQNGNVNVRADRSETACALSIGNTIAESGSVSEYERDVYASVGFGMDIAEELLAAHNIALQINQTDAYFDVSFDLNLV